MRWVSLESGASNCRLAVGIMDERGRTLLAKGIELTPSLVRKLLSIGITSVCIEDASTDDIVPNEFVNAGTRSRLLEATYTTLHELGMSPLQKFVKPSRVRQRFLPLIDEVLEQLKLADGAGEQLGTVYLSDGELYHHSMNVTFFSLCLGVGMGLPEEDLVDLAIGTLLHDVGKLRIPERILSKPGKLTAEEFEYVKLHTSYGYETLRKLPDLAPRTTLIALEHHERYDGSGYPRGLKGKEIHQFGRITGVADVYEALTANRIYRKGYLPHQAYELLLGGGGTQFDPLVIETFVKTISVYPIGMTLVLNTGEKAVVVKSRRQQSHRPLVRIIETSTGERLKQPREVDLANELTLHIIGCEI